MNPFLTLNKQLVFHRFDLCIKATKNTTFESWAGAVLRNNLQIAMAGISLPDQAITLFEYCCKQNPLPVEHPLYNQTRESFPRPYYLFVHYPEEFCRKTIEINRGELLHFSLVIIGSCIRYWPLFIEAVRNMCDKGMGVQPQPFVLIDVREASAWDENRLLYREGNWLSHELRYPFTFEPDRDTSRQAKKIEITFQSPTCLIKPRRQKDALGFQEKSNTFPGFYQFVRSAAYRLEKLHALYVNPHDTDNYIQSHACIESYVEQAAYALLEQVNIRKIYLQSTPKRGAEARIPLVGFTGSQSYQGDFSDYLPMLKYMEWLGVGHELTYGFGKYKIEIQ